MWAYLVLWFPHIVNLAPCPRLSFASGAHTQARWTRQDPITVGGLPRGEKAVQSVRQQSVMCVVML